MREAMLEKANGSVGGNKSWQEKPQGWDWREIKPAVIGWINALRMWETSRRHQNSEDGNLWELCGYPIVGKRRRGKDHRRGSHLKTNVPKWRHQNWTLKRSERPKEDQQRKSNSFVSAKQIPQGSA